MERERRTEEYSASLARGVERCLVSERGMQVCVINRSARRQLVWGGYDTIAVRALTIHKEVGL